MYCFPHKISLSTFVYLTGDSQGQLITLTPKNQDLHHVFYMTPDGVSWNNNSILESYTDENFLAAAFPRFNQSEDIVYTVGYRTDKLFVPLRSERSTVASIVLRVSTSREDSNNNNNNNNHERPVDIVFKNSKTTSYHPFLTSVSLMIFFICGGGVCPHQTSPKGKPSIKKLCVGHTD